MIKTVNINLEAGSSASYNEASGPGWFVIHDGEKVITIIEGKEGSFTATGHIIEEYKTKEEALAAMSAPRVKEQIFTLKYEDKKDGIIRP